MFSPVVAICPPFNHRRSGLGLTSLLLSVSQTMHRANSESYPRRGPEEARQQVMRMCLFLFYDPVMSTYLSFHRPQTFRTTLKMKSLSVQTLLHLLCGASLAAESSKPFKDAWAVYFWQSTHCTSASTAIITGADVDCHQIPFYGVTASLIYHVDNPEQRLLLYVNRNCTGILASHECTLIKSFGICGSCLTSDC